MVSNRISLTNKMRSRAAIFHVGNERLIIICNVMKQDCTNKKVSFYENIFMIALIPSLILFDLALK